MKANTLFKKLKVAHSKYEGATNALESEIVDRVEFDFSIIYQESDGFVMLNYETMGNARLSLCLGVIEKKGKLTEEDYKELTT